MKNICKLPLITISCVLFIVFITPANSFEYKDYLYGDDDSLSLQSPSIENARAHLIKFTPLKLVGLFNPAVEFGYEYVYKDNRSAQVMLSYMLPSNFFTRQDARRGPIKGFRIQLEQKRFRNSQAPIGIYYAYELNYLYHSHNSVFKFLDANAPDPQIELPYEDNVRIIKNIFSTNFKIGYQKNFGRLTLDYYFGIGLKLRNVNVLDRDHPNDYYFNREHIDIYTYTHNSDIGAFINIPLNIRIGWRL